MSVFSFSLVLTALSQSAHCAGMASNENFIVQASTQEVADAIAARADEYRSQIATQWLGQELEPRVGRTLLHVEISDEERSGQFWCQKGPNRKMHSLWLICSAEEANSNWLKRNIAKVVLETKHPGKLPPALLEGIAATYDDESLVLQRNQLLRWFARTGRWPDLGTLFGDGHLGERDLAGVAVAASLTEFLLSREDELTLIEFALAGHAQDWPSALQKYYGIDDVRALQVEWQVSVATSLPQDRTPQQEFIDPKYPMAEHNASMAMNENFTIYAHDRQMCLQLLTAAGELRDTISREWLGESLPPGVGHAIIRVELSDSEDRASMWFADPATRASQMVWITTSPEKVRSSLAHEVAHTVFATRYGKELPIWAHEAAASRYDNPRLKELRAVALQEMVRSGRFGMIEELLNSKRVERRDVSAYAMAVSLGKMLETRGGKAKFLQFAVDGERAGWPRALQEHYNIQDVAALQSLWERSLVQPQVGMQVVRRPR